MLRLLGILSLGRLIFGGRRHRLFRGILLGGLLGYLANRDFDADRMAKDVRQAARNAKSAAHDAVRAARREFRNAEHGRRAAEIREKIASGKARHEERLNTIHAEIEARKAHREAKNTVRALPTSGTNEAKAIRELTEDLERDARTAAMAANVPTIDFPEDEEKYFSSAKYGYVR